MSASAREGTFLFVAIDAELAARVSWMTALAMMLSQRLALMAEARRTACEAP